MSKFFQIRNSDGVVIRTLTMSLVDAELNLVEGTSLIPYDAEVSPVTQRWTGEHWEDLPPVVLSEEEILVKARAHRDRLLADSDWTQASDNRLSPEQRTAWTDVREQWRGRIDDLKSGLPPRAWADEPT